MPIKVRCPGCKKVIGAPDAARGKAIKCPKCETKIRVPSGSGKKKKKASAKKSAHDDGFLSGLDLSDAEDENVRLCPKCSIEVDPDDIDCPECGVNLQSGVLSARTQRMRSRKGPDPALFYSGVWKDSLTFVRNNKGLGIRTSIYWLIMVTLGGACGAMVTWCSNLPPKCFWGGLGMLFVLGTPGWLWFLWTEVIKGTMARKKRLNRVNLDIFMVMALGLKMVLWTIANMAQFAIMTAVILVPAWSMGLTPFIAIASILGTLSLTVFPVAMAHMSMPFTSRGWVSPILWKVTFKNFGAVLYWWLVTFVAMLASQIVIGIMAFIAMTYAAGVVVSFGLTIPDTIKVPGSGATLTKFVAITIVSVLAVLTALLVSVTAFASVYVMRANGQFVFYFKQKLELVTQVKVKKYVSKTEARAKKAQERKEQGPRMQVRILGGVGILAGIGASVYAVMNRAGYDFKAPFGTPDAIGVSVAALIAVVAIVAGLYFAVKG